jgi:WD40 repeat protein
MVSWDSSDKWVITAVSDHTLKIWNSETGEFGSTAVGVSSVQACVVSRVWVENGQHHALGSQEQLV